MTFKDIIGHNKTIDYLKKAIKRNELASAYLFWGSESIGKKAAAIAFARAVNCLSSDNADACGTCLSCKKIEKGIHPDVRIIAPEGETAEGKKSKVIKIEQIRAIQNEMAYPPLKAKKGLYYRQCRPDEHRGGKFTFKDTGGARKGFNNNTCNIKAELSPSYYNLTLSGDKVLLTFGRDSQKSPYGKWKG